MFELDGKVAVVTGCDTGLGQGMAIALATAGCDVAGINVAAADQTGIQVTSAGQRWLDLPADLRTASPTALIERVVAAFGRIDILVNNAGIIRRADAID